ncbi:MAG: hypothetical protein E5X86_19790 [Mesorhizobium sp.]|uniref:hypothetical protein n=1 Tax=Mesorhizobium sp. TaxID=1871066 RepID=UPI001210BD88|nr:hypothetical protein [Mesorhizobium sp.]TIO15614.1 MAG: hypothetical protein E5X86_19790 [Mesorhizobium sp.]
MIPNDIREAAQDALRTAITVSRSKNAEAGIAIIAEALMAERETQQKRAADILSAVADILAKRMTDLATPELLEALSAAIRSDNAGKP